MEATFLRYMEWIESSSTADDSAAAFNEWHRARYHGEPVAQTVIDRWRCQRADYDAIVKRAKTNACRSSNQNDA